MSSHLPLTTHRHAYLPPAWWVEQVNLSFQLGLEHTVVTAELSLRRNAQQPGDCVLNGEGLQLQTLLVNGQAHTDYHYADDQLRLHKVPEQFTLHTVVSLKPSANTSLMGLYASNGSLFTQCEAEGFRKITFFPDRPDVMARYQVRLQADKTQFPVLLSNGNLLEQGDLPGGQHYALWQDPFAKPCYLFALVAGQLVCEEQRIQTAAGHDALLQVWVEPGNLDKTQHAMQSLIRAIAWDEKRFGLSLDLERFMIVAVSDFNMGAMENKGLNIFNTKYVLANAAIATDTDYANIESVVGHEYFHNWTGNRVTCRDWFQLSLKEGLTVFRDQEFSADRLGTESGRAVKRIEDVRTLRALQFPEDTGPMAHPIRPDSYQEISNFYTVTVYEKGAEVIRMLHTLLGEAGFQRGMQEYFARHDGQAVTCDDFVAAMEAANQVDLRQFRHWYSQAGTPQLTVKRHDDAATKTCTLQISQHTAATPGQSEKLPFHIPLTLAWFDSEGAEIRASQLLELTQAEQSFVFDTLPAHAVPSLLRNFSAPVVLHDDLSQDEIALLFQHDTDPFNRWEAGQRLMLKELLSQVQAGSTPNQLSSVLTAAFARLLRSDFDPAFIELALTLPSESYIADQLENVDPSRIAQARQALKIQLAQTLQADWQATYTRLTQLMNAAPYHPEGVSAGKRALRHLALNYLVELGETGLALARTQYASANNMTDRFAALSALVHMKSAQVELADFYQRFEHEALVLDKWFVLQAASRHTSAVQLVALLKHVAFNLKNPNRARSVILQFCMNNPANFHAADGSGYALWTEYVLKLDSLNPQVAARLARCVDQWRRFTPDRQSLMRAALERVAAKPGLSKDVLEVVTKALEPVQSLTARA